MAWVTPFLLLVGVIFLAAASMFLPLILLTGSAVVGLLVAFSRDLVNRCTYSLTDDRLVLERDGEKERLEIALSDITDASLIDRAAAREYIRSRMHRGDDPRTRRSLIRAITRYCTVDIGMTSLTLGIGRGVIDRLPEARHDLVLLRMRDRSELLLSPQFNQDLVSSVTRFSHPG